MVLNFTLEVCQQCHNSARGALVGSVKCNPGEGYFDERYKGKGVTPKGGAIRLYARCDS